MQTYLAEQSKQIFFFSQVSSPFCDRLYLLIRTNIPQLLILVYTTQVSSAFRAH